MVHLVLVALLLGLGSGAANASQQGVTAVQRWKAMDKCATQAQTAFPDYTPEANAKRDARMKECLAAQNLPPREPPSPPR